MNNTETMLQQLLPMKIKKLDSKSNAKDVQPVFDSYLFDLIESTIRNQVGDAILVSDIKLDELIRYKDSGKYSSMLKGMKGHVGFEAIDVCFITNTIVSSLKSSALFSIANYYSESIRLLSREISCITSYFNITEIAKINAFIEYLKEVMNDIHNGELLEGLVIPSLTKLQDIKTEAASIENVNRYKIHDLLSENNCKEALECFLKIKYCSMIRIFVCILEPILTGALTEKAANNAYKKITAILENIDTLNTEMQQNILENNSQINRQLNRWDAKLYWLAYYDMQKKVGNLNIKNDVINRIISEIDETSLELKEKLSIENIKNIMEPQKQLLIQKAT